MFTIVCTKCHAGWQADTPDKPCGTCHQVGQVRDHYAVIDLTKVLVGVSAHA